MHWHRHEKLQLQLSQLHKQIEQQLEREQLADSKNNRGERPLHTAASTSTAKGVQLLLQRGVDPTAPDGAERIPLYAAIENANTDAVTMLMPYSHPFECMVATSMARKHGLAHLAATMVDTTRHLSATLIQSSLRGLNAVMNRRIDAAWVIQKAMRGAIRRRQAFLLRQRMHGRRHRAANTIARAWYCFKARRELLKRRKLQAVDMILPMLRGVNGCTAAQRAAEFRQIELEVSACPLL